MFIVAVICCEQRTYIDRRIRLHPARPLGWMGERELIGSEVVNLAIAWPYECNASEPSKRSPRRPRSAAKTARLLSVWSGRWRSCGSIVAGKWAIGRADMPMPSTVRCLGSLHRQRQSHCLGHGKECGESRVAARRQGAVEALPLDPRRLGNPADPSLRFGHLPQGSQQHSGFFGVLDGRLEILGYVTGWQARSVDSLSTKIPRLDAEVLEAAREVF
jgi:hypothetical protein